MTDQPLSPAAQAVLDATCSRWPRSHEWVIAAALQAAADQVVPKRDTPLLGDDASYADWNARDDVRDEFLAIAAELKAQ
jgi:hypothetical protein